jgi:hypothetical protein
VAEWGSYAFLWGPMVTVAVLLVLMVLLRWAFSRGGSLVRRPGRPGRTDEYGLLVAVASPGTVIEAEMMRRRLEDAGIRSTLAETTEGPRVMVFRSERVIAEHVLSSSP